MIDGLFTTVTNVDFTAEAVSRFVVEGVRLRDKAKQLAGAYAGPVPAAPKLGPPLRSPTRSSSANCTA